MIEFIWSLILCVYVCVYVKKGRQKNWFFVQWGPKILFMH